MAQAKEAEIIKALMPVFVLIICLVVIKKFFSGAFKGLGDLAGDIGEAGGLGAKIGIAKGEAELSQMKEVKRYIDKYNSAPSQNPFLPTYHKEIEKYAVSMLAPDESVKILADRINSAENLFGYNAPRLVSAFTGCKFKTHVSWLAEIYGRHYGSLWNYLTTNWYNTTSIKEAALLEIFRYVESLPKGAKDRNGKIS